MRRAWLFVVVGIFLLTSGSTDAADWPFARGDEQSTGTAPFALPDDPEVVWSYAPGGEVSFEGAPVIAAGIVYLVDADGGVHALKLRDGAVVWATQLAETIVLAGPAFDDNRLFIGDADGLVRALSTTDGKELWQFDAEGEVYAGPLVYHPPTSDPLLLVTTELGRLYALNPVTGIEQWRYEIKDPLRCAPTVVAGHALLAGCDGKLHTVELQNGTQAGFTEIGGPTGCTAAVRDGVAYFGTEAGVFYAIDANDPQKPAVAWTFSDPRRRQGIRTAAAVGVSTTVFGNQAKAVYALASRQGERLWVKTLKSRLEAAPLIVGDRVLLATSRGRLLLLDLATGEEAWQYEAGGGFLADPAAADGRVIVASTDGVVYCLGEGNDEPASAPHNADR
ncbi:outer membrane protein assembly factor BamB family protein [Botrimarina hoheduenensis]|uniref:Outer membrane protein assembly factor BamB n=1 Tax=Botrimarina hoheduenensis TaxID=2528000 RepID=A0A5C5W0G3_9BACT|nr:PQQ-binding-like beta-propeller repeat protein [Botrimarina hoheduenensis]TWT43262.1 Outer membrane protein assembly factor BamB precursor [Botrimarina hoheduenensis]